MKHMERELYSANNFVGAELGIVSPSPGPCTSKGPLQAPGGFTSLQDVRDHKQSMRIEAP
jgi:hypothetical protein